MAENPVAPRMEDTKGAGRLALGGALGVVAALVTLVLPSVFLWLALYSPGGFFSLGSTLLQTLSLLVLVGAILFLLSLFVYRLGFATLRKVDPRFSVASILCIIGTLGFLLVVVAAAVLLGSTNSLVQCLHGQPSHALSCLKSGQPLGAYTAVIGFWLGWLGGVGLMVGLSSAGRRFARGSLYGAAILYGLLLLVLIGPFLALVYSVPDQQYLLLVVPVLALFAPLLTLLGTLTPPATVRRA
jgi:NADH:ubiquinone oxidoreductase subunit 6 (subunit J)